MVKTGKEFTTLTADIAHRDVGDKINGEMGKWRQEDLVQGSINYTTSSTSVTILLG